MHTLALSSPLGGRAGGWAGASADAAAGGAPGWGRRRAHLPRAWRRGPARPSSAGGPGSSGRGASRTEGGPESVAGPGARAPRSRPPCPAPSRLFLSPERVVHTQTRKPHDCAEPERQPCLPLDRAPLPAPRRPPPPQGRDTGSPLPTPLHARPSDAAPPASPHGARAASFLGTRERGRPVRPQSCRRQSRRREVLGGRGAWARVPEGRLSPGPACLSLSGVRLRSRARGRSRGLWVPAAALPGSVAAPGG